MAFDITNSLTQFDAFIPAKALQVTDATATTTTQGDFGSTASFKHFRAFVYCSAFTKPDGNAVASAGATFALEVSNSSNFDAANAAVYQIDSMYIPATIAASVKPAFKLEGMTPLVAGLRYSRITYAGGTNGAVNFDAIIEAA